MQKTQMLKENRLFRALYARGKSSARKTMAVYVFQNRLKTVNRLGITVSVKLGGAVTRNRIRRRLREVYRLYEPQLRPGLDLVIVGRHAALTASFAELQADFADIARTLRMEARPC